MDVYLGRQPILDRTRNTAGYELLFRSGRANFYDSADAATATSQVIGNAILGVGLDRLLGGKPAFINFDRSLLLGDWTTLLPPGKSVIEIVETVEPDQEVLSACQTLQRQGYALALDGCQDDQRTADFAPFIDILKIDLQLTSPGAQERIIQRYRKLRIRMVAMKVETEPEFRRALQLGYDYFQGYFFAPPTILRTAGISTTNVNALHLIRQIQREDLNYLAIERLIENDVSFSKSLLAYLNSAVFRWADRIESVRQSLLLLGSDRIRKWVWMASLASFGQYQSPALMAPVLMRGRFCEAIASAANLMLGESDTFLLGMLSLLETILDRPLEGIYDDLNIGRNLRRALLGTADEGDPLSLILRIVKAHEAGDWDRVKETAQIIGLSGDALNTCYLESLSWVDAVVLSAEQKNVLNLSQASIDFRRGSEMQRNRLPLPPGPPAD